MFLVYSELNDAFLNFLYIFSVNWQKKKKTCVKYFAEVQ